MRAPPLFRTHGLALASALALALAAAALAYALLAGHGSGRPVALAGAGQRFDGAPLPGTPAPGFTLRGSGGRPVSLTSFRGRVVVLAFLYTGCGPTCELIAQQIRGALDELAAERAPAPAVLIVSAEPRGDTPARIAGLLAAASLGGRAQYLTGSASELRRVWHVYGVRPASAGHAAFAEYASVLLLDARGAERVLFQSEQLTPEALGHDIASLQRGEGRTG